MSGKWLRNFIVATTCAGLLCAQTASAQVLWSSTWNVTTPLLLDTYPEPSLFFTEDGGAILGSLPLSAGDRKTTRINANAGVLWSSSLYGYRGYFDQPTGTALDMEDGGAVVTLGASWPYASGEISRLGADGKILWSRSALVETISRLDANQLVYSGCNILTAVDIQTGNANWQVAFDRSRYCHGNSTSIDESQNVYASFSMSTGNQVTGYRIVKTDSSGLVQWNVSAQAVGGASIIGVGSTALYMKSGSQLIAASKLDGSTLWSVPVWAGSTILVTEDAAAEPVVIDTAFVRRLSAANGSEIWSASTPACVTCAKATITGDSVVALVNLGRDLVKINAVTGAIEWTTALLDEDADGKPLKWLGFGRLAGNQLLGVASARSEGASTAHFQAINFDTGVLQLASEPSELPQGLLGESVVDGNDVFDAAFRADEVKKALH
ncbi:PQQ-binding-like beta-propeller repeat protein, partial [Dokdonella sp.]|uniref:outer membrane protein assembly factor BamB family protein n=1 Tax=Dokdonella sp. TaxID=2291710 RepID=UPI003C4F4B00